MIRRVGIVADGRSRLDRSEDFQARLRESVRARHAAEMAEAGFLRRFLLRWRIAAEFRRERRKMGPSPQSLFSHIAGMGSRRA